MYADVPTPIEPERLRKLPVLTRSPMTPQNQNINPRKFRICSPPQEAAQSLFVPPFHLASQVADELVRGGHHPGDRARARARAIG